MSAASCSRTELLEILQNSEVGGFVGGPKPSSSFLQHGSESLAAAGVPGAAGICQAQNQPQGCWAGACGLEEEESCGWPVVVATHRDTYGEN